MAEIEVPLVGPSNNARNDVQRSINLFPRKMQREGEKTRWHLCSAPGLTAFATLTDTPIRGRYVHDGRLFVVAKNKILEVYSTGTTYEWGRINSVRGQVTMAENSEVIVIGDGAAFYALDLSTGTVAVVTDAPTGRHCLSFNQRILYLERDTGRVHYSELNDPTNIPELNFFTAENRPDDLVTILNTEDQVWLIGEDTTEVWYDSGDGDNPFQRIPGSVVFNGCMAANSALRTDNSIIWPGRNEDGTGQVFRTSGFNHLVISTHPVEAFLKTATNLSAYSYQEDGNHFYVLNADEGTWALDLSQNEWSERAYLNPATGLLERARGELHAYCYGKHLITDYENGKIYEASTSIYSDNGNPMPRKRVFRGPYSAGQRIIVDELFIDMAVGVGIDGSGQGNDPLVMLRYSANGGKTWSAEIHGEIGAIGEYSTKVRFHRLGMGSDWVFEVSVSDPVPVTMFGALARIRAGTR